MHRNITNNITLQTSHTHTLNCPTWIKGDIVPDISGRLYGKFPGKTPLVSCFTVDITSTINCFNYLIEMVIFKKRGILKQSSKNFYKKGKSSQGMGLLGSTRKENFMFSYSIPKTTYLQSMWKLAHVYCVITISAVATQCTLNFDQSPKRRYYIRRQFTCNLNFN